MKFLKRILGICETRPPQDNECWRIDGNGIILDLNRSPELAKTGGAVRLEGRGLSERILIVHGTDDRFHAFRNRCTHMGRRIDSKPEANGLECCSISKSAYNYDGEATAGPAGESLTIFPVERQGDNLLISLKETDSAHS